MKTKILLTAILISPCLTSWAWFRPSITQSEVDQIRIGQTTEADLVHLFGAPTTRFVELRNIVALDWFRSVPATAPTYLPLIKYFVAPLAAAQQLTVVFGSSGRVLRYEVHSSKGQSETRSATGCEDDFTEVAGAPRSRRITISPPGPPRCSLPLRFHRPWRSWQRDGGMTLHSAPARVEPG